MSTMSLARFLFSSAQCRASFLYLSRTVTQFRGAHAFYRPQNDSSIDNTSLNRRQRRDAAFGTIRGSSSTQARQVSRSVSSNTKFRLRSDKGRGSRTSVKQFYVKKDLEPHILSNKIRKLCEKDRLEDAVSMVKNAPLDAQNTPVWNTLVWECLKAEKYQLAFRLYAEMRRRGFHPSIRTYLTMLSGLSRIEDWTRHSKQLQNAHSLFDSYREDVTLLKQLKPKDRDISPTPIAPYFTILGNNGLQQRMFDIYYTLDQDGPLAPNQLVYTAMFRALSKRKGIFHGSEEQNASSAKLLWTEMMKRSRQANLPLDSRLVASAISALTQGRSSDHELAFKLVGEYFGFYKDGLSPSTQTSVLPLEVRTISVILTLCIASNQFATCICFFEELQQKQRKRGSGIIIDKHHCEQVLEAYRGQAEPGYAARSVALLEWMMQRDVTGKDGTRVRPAHDTFMSVFHSCWREADWMSAVMAFQLMSGYHLHDFMDGSVSPRPRIDRRSPGKSIGPDSATLSIMLRTASASQNHAYMRQCLRLTDFVLTRSTSLSHRQIGRKANRKEEFFTLKLQSAIQETVTKVLSRDGKFDSEQERSRWAQLATKSQKSLEYFISGDDYIKIPDDPVHMRDATPRKGFTASYSGR